MKCSIEIICLNHPQTIPLNSGLWKNHLPWNQPERWILSNESQAGDLQVTRSHLKFFRQKLSSFLYDCISSMKNSWCKILYKLHVYTIVIHSFLRLYSVVYVCVCVCVKLLGTIWLCNPLDCSLPGSSDPWDSPGKSTGVGCHFLLPEIEPESLAAAGRFFTTEQPGKPTLYL